MANVLTRNTISGVVGYVPESYLTHPVFSKQLEKVEEGAKNALPEMYKPKTVNKDGQKKVIDSDKSEKIADAKPEAPSDSDIR